MTNYSHVTEVLNLDRRSVSNVHQNIRVLGVACGSTHFLCWDLDGVLYAWGSTACGKLGLPILIGSSQ